MEVGCSQTIVPDKSEQYEDLKDQLLKKKLPWADGDGGHVSFRGVGVGGHWLRQVLDRAPNYFIHHDEHTEDLEIIDVLNV